MRRRALAARALLAAVTVVVAAAGAAAVTAPRTTEPARTTCGGKRIADPPEPPRPRPPRSAGEVVRAGDVGAVGDGTTDDGPALQRALDRLAPGDVLELAAGRVYRHDDVLRLRRPDTGLTGAAVLRASDEQRSALLVEADRVTVDGGLVLEAPDTSRRWSGVDQHRLSVVGASHAVIRDVHVAGSAAAGIFLTGAADFIVDGVTVEDTRADGLHVTGGSTRGSILDATSRRTGDDGVAVVSYVKDARTTSDVTVTGAVVSQMTGGRGISVVGGERVLLCDVEVTDSWAAALYIATEGAPYFTRDVRHVTVVGAELTGSNRSPEIDHGAVLIFNGQDGAVVEQIRLLDLEVTDTSDRAGRQLGLLDGSGPLRDVLVQGLRISGGGGRPFESTTSPAAYRLSDWTVDRRRQDDLGASSVKAEAGGFASGTGEVPELHAPHAARGARLGIRPTTAGPGAR